MWRSRMVSGLGINDERVPHDLVAKVLAEIHGRTQIDLTSAEQPAQCLLNVGKPEKANPLLGPKVDEDINVAAIGEPAGDRGAEQGEFANAVTPAKLGDLGLRNVDFEPASCLSNYASAANSPALVFLSSHGQGEETADSLAA